MLTANAIKFGSLNLEQSYKHSSLDDCLISKDRWNQEKEPLLEWADLTEFVDPKKVLRGLDKILFEQYQTTNTNALAGKNPHLKILNNGQFRIATSAFEEKDSDPLRQLFPKRHYVPLTEVLATVNQHCCFLDELQHWQQRHIRTTIPYHNLYAGVMALGCGIGTHKMGQISSQITENELVQVVNLMSLNCVRLLKNSSIKQNWPTGLPALLQSAIQENILQQKKRTMKLPRAATT